MKSLLKCHSDSFKAPLSMNVPATNPPLTPPRRGTGQPVLLPSWEGLGAGSRAQCVHKIRGILSWGEGQGGARVRMGVSRDRIFGIGGGKETLQ